MAKTRTIFICQECGHQVSKWLGKCPECNSWNSFSEERQLPPTSFKSRNNFESPAPLTITEVLPVHENLMMTGIGEFDRGLLGSPEPRRGPFGDRRLSSPNWPIRL